MAGEGKWVIVRADMWELLNDGFDTCFPFQPAAGQAQAPHMFSAELYPLLLSLKSHKCFGELHLIKRMEPHAHFKQLL